VDVDWINLAPNKEYFTDLLKTVITFWNELIDQYFSQGLYFMQLALCNDGGLNAM
jgi:hypothetical protein